MKRSGRSTVIVQPALGLVFAFTLLTVVAVQAGNAAMLEGAWREQATWEAQDLSPVHQAQQEPPATPDSQDEMPPGEAELEDPTTAAEEGVEPVEETLSPGNPFGHTCTMGGKS